MYTQPKCTVPVLLCGTVQIRTAGVRKFHLMQIAVYYVVNYGEVSQSGTPGVNVLRYLPRRYYLCTHSLSALFVSYFGLLYRSVQQVYENSVRCRLLCTVW